MKMKKIATLTTILSLLMVTNLMVAQDLVSVQNRRGAALTARVEKNGTASRIFGIKDNISQFGYSRQSLNSESVGELGKRIVDDYRDILKVQSNDLFLKKADSDGAWWFVRYEQKVGGVPIYGSEIGFTVDPHDNVVSLGARAYPDVNISVAPQIAPDAAILAAKDAFQAEDSKLESDPRLVILPVENDTSFSYHLCWTVHLQASNPLKEYIFFVNAVNGTILKEENNLRDSDIYGTISGNYYPVHNYDTPVSTIFQTTNIKLYNSYGGFVAQTNTNANGYYSFTGLAYAQYYVKIELQNSWVMVRDQSQSGDPVTVTIGTAPGQVNYAWAAGDGANVRRHASYVHDFFKGSPFNHSGMDYQMHAYINNGSGTNGSANGSTIFFGSYGGQQWARSSDVVFHEYTHNVQYNVYGGWIGNSLMERAMEEGLSDYFACTINSDNYWGEDVSATRNLNNTHQFSTQQSIHWNGQVIAGAIWDVRQAIGQTAANNLAFKALQISPSARSFSDYLYNMLIADNSHYGGNYHQTILNAFSTHGITVQAPTTTILGPPSIYHPEKNNPANQYTWTAVPSGGRSPFTYRWSRGGYQLGTNSTYTEYLSYDGEGGGSTQWTLDLEIWDAGGFYATASKLITEYHSGGIDPKIGGLDQTAILVPEEFSIAQNYPNPFNPETEITFALPENSVVRLTVVDLLGREVLNLKDEQMNAGYHHVKWTGKNSHGEHVGSGVYFYRIVATGQSGKQFTKVLKMVLTK